MKVFYHEQFASHYANDPAAEPGRLEPALAVIKKRYPLNEPQPALKDDILRVHSERHYDRVASDQLLCSTALLAAGSAVAAAEAALNGEHAFALCRPPGHHASADSSWGFCYFNNIAVAVKKLLHNGAITSALIVDFDLHYGDGTAGIFRGDKAVSFWHSQEGSRERYLQQLEADLKDYQSDIVAVSAGFDRGVNDWGGMLTVKDYENIGLLLGSYAREHCKKSLFAVLEGGYNARAMAENISAFLDGLDFS